MSREILETIHQAMYPHVRVDGLQDDIHLARAILLGRGIAIDPADDPNSLIRLAIRTDMAANQPRDKIGQFSTTGGGGRGGKGGAHHEKAAAHIKAGNAQGARKYLRKAEKEIDDRERQGHDVSRERAHIEGLRSQTKGLNKAKAEPYEPTFEQAKHNLSEHRLAKAADREAAKTEPKGMMHGESDEVFAQGGSKTRDRQLAEKAVKGKLTDAESKEWDDLNDLDKKRENTVGDLMDSQIGKKEAYEPTFEQAKRNLAESRKRENTVGDLMDAQIGKKGMTRGESDEVFSQGDKARKAIKAAVESNPILQQNIKNIQAGPSYHKELVSNAEKMFGTNSKQHLEAIKRWGRKDSIEWANTAARDAERALVTARLMADRNSAAKAIAITVKRLAAKAHDAAERTRDAHVCEAVRMDSAIEAGKWANAAKAAIARR